jgi:hypothetical protein
MNRFNDKFDERMHNKLNDIDMIDKKQCIIFRI